VKCDASIQSAANPRVKDVVRLRRRSHREKTGLTVVEGYPELTRAEANRHPVHTVFFCPTLFQGTNEPALIERCAAAGAEAIECSPAVFAKMSYRDRPDGLLAVAPPVRHSLGDLALPDAPLLVVAESIEKPGNLGTILRSADGAGADAVLVCDRCTDVSNPNVIRASIGTVFALPVVEADTADTLAWLRANHVAVVAATPDAERLYTETDLAGGIALVVGTEQVGLSRPWLAAADRRVRIPMHGQADSLNVAQAATLLLYEAVRQRAARP